MGKTAHRVNRDYDLGKRTVSLDLEEKKLEKHRNLIHTISDEALEEEMYNEDVELDEEALQYLKSK